MSDSLLETTSEKLGRISPTVCGAKWFQTTIHLFNGNTQSCHHVKSHRVSATEVKRSPQNLHNSEKKVAVRNQMLEGVQVSECRYCWDMENAGELSDRHIKSSQDWSLPNLESDQLINRVDRTIPTYLEVAFENICNLKCMYCSPVYSSSWLQEIKEHGPYPTSRRFNNLTWFKIDQVLPLADKHLQIYKNAFWSWWPEIKHQLQHLRVTGGEPLLSRDLWKLMDEIKGESFPQLIFSINSNMMTPPKLLQRFLSDLNQIQSQVAKVILFCSIDSVGDKAEYLRHGLKEETFYSNLEHLLSESTKPLHISFMITVSALSLSGLPQLIERIALLKQKYPQHEIDFDTPYLRNPAHLSVLILPEEYQIYIDQTLEVVKKYSFPQIHAQKISRIKEFWNENTYKGLTRLRLQRDFKIMMIEHDRRRGTDFAKVFPEYQSFFSSIWHSKWLPAI